MRFPANLCGLPLQPLDERVAATATGTEMVQITTSQASGIAAPAPGMRGWKAVVPAASCSCRSQPGNGDACWLQWPSWLILVVD